MVKPGLDRDLDRMKDSYDGLNSLLKQVAIEIATTIPEHFDIDVNVIYFPQLGFNIAIPLNDRGEAAFNGSEEEWELIFVTENRAYFKDFRMRQLDENLGDIYGLICGKYSVTKPVLADNIVQRRRLRSSTSWHREFSFTRTSSWKLPTSVVNWTGEKSFPYGNDLQEQSSSHGASSELLQAREAQDG